MSTRENIRLIARTPSLLVYLAPKQHMKFCYLSHCRVTKSHASLDKCGLWLKAVTEPNSAKHTAIAE